MNLATQPVNRLLQGAAGVLVGALGPQVADQFVAAQAAVARHNEQGQDRQPLSLSDERMGVCVGQCQPAKHLESSHGAH